MTPPAPSPARPRGLQVGDLSLAGGTARLRKAIAIETSEPAALVQALDENRPDVVLLDDRIPVPDLLAILERVGHPDRPDRPAVVVVTGRGRGAGLPDLVDHADDVVDEELGEEVLLSRVRTALRVRSCLAELARKNTELEGLYARLERLAGRMAEDLRLASHVQRTLLPPPLNHPRLDIAAEFVPVREIGGDYYDLVPLAGSRLAVALGDVMGKGVAAALVASNLKACLRAHVQAGSGDAAAIIARVNRLFWEVSPKSLFATLFFGVFDFEAGRFDYVNAGHPPALAVRTDGRVEDLSVGGTVLGLEEQSVYRTGHVALGRDDRIVLFSDGLIDRAGPQGDLFGLDRLREAARGARHDPARIALYSLLGEIQGFSGGGAAEDDVTLIVARVR